jgi:putative ABC transport system permease protein
MNGHWRELKYVIRSLLLHRKFTTVSLLTIIITVSGITTVFTLVNAVLFRPLPYLAADRLVMIWQVQEKSIIPGSRLAAVPDILDIRRDAKALDAVALYQVTSATT